MNEKGKAAQKLSEYEKWVSEEIQKLASLTRDAQLKDKYEEISAQNKIFCEKLGDNGNESDGLKYELELLKRALFWENAIFHELCNYMTQSERPTFLDEISDRQLAICRELLNEADKLEKTLDKKCAKISVKIQE